MTHSQRATPANPGRSTQSEPSEATMLALVADGYGTADYTTSHFTSDARRYDLIIDIAGNATLTQLRDALTSNGTAVLVGEDHDQITGGMMRQLRGWALSLSRRRRFVGLLSKERGSDLKVLTDLIESGQMKPHVDRSFCLGDAADAMRHLESGEILGKIAILPCAQTNRGE